MLYASPVFCFKKNGLSGQEPPEWSQQNWAETGGNVNPALGDRDHWLIDQWQM